MSAPDFFWVEGDNDGEEKGGHEPAGAFCKTGAAERREKCCFEQANELRMSVIELEKERDTLIRKKCDIETEIQNRNVELSKLDLMLADTIRKKRSLEEKIKAMPVAKMEAKQKA